MKQAITKQVEVVSQAHSHDDLWITEVLEKAKADAGIMDLMSLAGYIDEIQKHPLEGPIMLGYSWVATDALVQR